MKYQKLFAYFNHLDVLCSIKIICCFQKSFSYKMHILNWDILSAGKGIYFTYAPKQEKSCITQAKTIQRILFQFKMSKFKVLTKKMTEPYIIFVLLHLFFFTDWWYRIFTHKNKKKSLSEFSCKFFFLHIYEKVLPSEHSVFVENPHSDDLDSPPPLPLPR